jgi:hypothetical protein
MSERAPELAAAMEGPPTSRPTLRDDYLRSSASCPTFKRPQAHIEWLPVYTAMQRVRATCASQTSAAHTSIGLPVIRVCLICLWYESVSYACGMILSHMPVV